MTTIQIDQVAKQRLDILKAEYGASSYNAVILKLTRDKTPKEMFGSLNGIGSWSKKDRMRSKHE